MNIPNEPTLVRIGYQDLKGNEHSQEYVLHRELTAELLPTTRSSEFSERPALGEWSMLAGRADEWFHAHMLLSAVNSPPVIPLSPFVFTAGHAVELYLKAVVTANESLKTAINLAHKLPLLWKRCETYDRFPFKGLLLPELLNLDRDIYSPEGRTSFSLGVQHHLGENELLYLALRHVQDLKYLGVPGRTLHNEHKLSFGSPVPNKVMISQLGRLAHWTWGQWAGRPGYNNSSLYEHANSLLQGA